MSKLKKRCTCGERNKQICHNCSRFRIVIYPKKKYLHLFPELEYATLKGKVFYSRYSKNQKSFNSVLFTTKNNLYKIQNDEFQKALRYHYSITFYDNLHGGKVRIDNNY